MTVHVNPETGEASTCRARQGKCPFGAEAHFDTIEAAHEYAEQIMEAEHGGTATVKKTVEPEPLRLTNESCLSIIGKDTYNGELLGKGKILFLRSASMDHNLEAARILQRLEKTNIELAENDTPWIYREREPSARYRSQRGSREALLYEREHGKAAMHDKFPETFDIDIYICSGCRKHDCVGQCLERGEAFLEDAETLKNGDGIELIYGESRGTLSRLRDRVLKKYERTSDAVSFIEENLHNDLAEFAEAKGVDAPTTDDVWVEDYKLGNIRHRTRPKAQTIYSTPEYADMVVDMLHFQAMKESESNESK